MGSAESLVEDPLKARLESDTELEPKTFPSSAGRTHALSTSPARTLGYEIYGKHDAPPDRTILFMHGTPGTRFFFSRDHSAHASSHDVRVIVPERPGYGLSTAAPGRTMRSTVADCAELLEALGVARAHVMGYSAGGPFALAFARWHSERCASVCVVSSLSPNVRGVTDGMTMLSKFGYFLSARFPWLLKRVVRMMVRDALAENFDGKRSDFTAAENEAFLGDFETRRAFVRSTLELYGRPEGAEAEAEDYVLMARDWGFALGDIAEEVQVFVYSGDEDNKCTIGMYNTLVSQLPGRNLTQTLGTGEHHLWFYRLFEERLLQDIGLV